MSCWHVRVHWRDGQGRLWETGGDIGFPDGTTWEEATREIIKMRGAPNDQIHKVEVEKYRDD